MSVCWCFLLHIHKVFSVRLGPRMWPRMRFHVTPSVTG
uniref:Uncharacterized protein n=1 Tax=Anopheles atroparvus TaxID=41427 RepID=A0AAG5DBF2_ANOAO